MNSPSFFSISGCQRSGTTLMRLILDSHKKIHCFDELKSYDILKGTPGQPKPLIARIPANGPAITGFKIPRLAEQLDYEYFDEFEYGKFPNEVREFPTVFMIRNVLDVISSMVSLKLNETNWLRAHGLPILKFMAEKPRFRHHYHNELEYIQKTNENSFAVGALIWRYKTEAIFRYLDQGMMIKPVFYDELILNPQLIIRDILEFLKLDWDISVLNHHTIEHDEVNADGMAIGQTNAREPIHHKSYKKNIEIYDINAKDMIRKITQPALEQMEAKGWKLNIP